MESQNKKVAQHTIRRTLAAFCKLGPDAGAGRGRVWILLDKNNANVAKSCEKFITIHELLGIERQKLITAFGNKWQGKFDGGELSLGFKCDTYCRGKFVSIDDGYKFNDPPAHLPEFVDRYGMLGRISEESFESVHALMARVKEMVVTMRSDSQRIETASAKAQTKLKPGCMEATIKIREESQGKKRGPAKTKPTRHNKVTLLSDIDFKERTVGGKVYLEILDAKARLPKEWRDLYLLVSAGKVPESWTQVFDDSIHLSDERKEEAKFINH